MFCPRGFYILYSFVCYLLKRKNYASSEKPLTGVPTLIKEKEPLWYGVPQKPSTKKKRINGNQEGCRLDLKPAPDGLLMLREGSAFCFITLGRVGRRPLLCAQDSEFFCATVLFLLRVVLFCLARPRFCALEGCQFL
jgi:hypothetical protein